MDTQTIKHVELLVRINHARLVIIPPIFVLNVMLKSFFTKTLVGISAHCHWLAFHLINPVFKDVELQE